MMEGVVKGAVRQANCGFPIADCGLKELESAIRFPQSEIETV
jgi:hypothetical protein